MRTQIDAAAFTEDAVVASPTFPRLIPASSPIAEAADGSLACWTVPVGGDRADLAVGFPDLLSSRNLRLEKEPTLNEHYDVVVVGARCAGATLAHDLAAAGASVAVVDRARFPSDTLSTHFFQTPGVRTIVRLGLLDEMTSSGAPFVDLVDLRVGDVTTVEPYWRGPDDPCSCLCIRRTVLDAALVRAAGQAGAAVRTDTRVTGLVSADGRVTGVTVTDGAGRDRPTRRRPRRRCRRHGVHGGPSGRGPALSRRTEPALRLLGLLRRCTRQPVRERCCGTASTTSSASASLATPGFTSPASSRPSTGWLPSARTSRGPSPQPWPDPNVSTARLADSRRVGPAAGAWPAIRCSSESRPDPGWALVGDAGHFKDPVPGQGISDAFRQAERLAADIVSGLGGATPLDAVLSDWWAWRDADAIDMHWLGADLGAAGPVPAVVVELIRDLHGSPGGLWDFWGLFHHATRTTDVFTPERLAAVAERVAGTPLGERVMAELVGMAELAEGPCPALASPSSSDDSDPPRGSFRSFSG